MQSRIAALLLLISLCATGTVLAGTPQEGVAAFRRGDSETALKDLLPLAQSGDAMAEAAVGIIYEDSKGAAQNFAEAVKWYRLAARQGNEEAQFNLGVMYREGMGVARDFARAEMWFALAAQQGDTEAADDRDELDQRLAPQQLTHARYLLQKCIATHLKGCD